jgi:predicted enzyme related to lactoylglutathione lyase
MFKYVKFADLPVKNQDHAVAFYTQKIGLQVARDMQYEEDWRWIEIEIPGAATKILLTRKTSEAPTDVPSLVLVVEDVDMTYESLQKNGVDFTQTPTDAAWDPNQRFALFHDSEGNTILITNV